MKHAPVIVVQLVHMQGPLKGQIQEFQDATISIGRHPECHVLFPKDLTIVSRRHAQLVREGNRFKLIDQSTNGTFLNGKRIKEAFLKDGDVVLFAEGGPKVSFLTKVVDDAGQESLPRPPSPPVIPYVPIREKASERSSRPPEPQRPAPPSAKTAAPLTIQYGPTLHSFKELPVTLGKGEGCDFALNHPAIMDRHAQFFFAEGRYWVKDLTGRNSITVDGLPVQAQASLETFGTLRLSPQGPAFRFLGGGRFAELEEDAPQEAVDSPGEEREKPSRSSQAGRGKGSGPRMKKFWGR